MAARSAILQLTDVGFRWPGRRAFGLSVGALQVNAGEKVLLLGPSGSGKSTLLSLICGTLTATEGCITVAGKDLSGLSGAARDRLRAEKIGVIFQQFNLLPFGQVLDNILLPLHFAPERRRRAGDLRAEALRLTRALGLGDEILSARASALSVGQQQRVAVARALIGRPPVIIADEPASALDADNQSAFLELLFDQIRTHGSTLLMVSHDARFAGRFDRVLAMADITGSQRPAA